MYILTYPRELYDEKNLDKIMILKLILKHQIFATKLVQNKRYYDAKHKICNRTRKNAEAPNVKVVCNHAKDIADTAAGYFMGNPITYDNTAEGDIEPLLEAFDLADTDDIDSELAHDMGIYGLAYEYDYVKEDETELSTKVLSPEQTFIVHDDTIEENELFAVYYYFKKNDVDDTGTYIATVLTEHYKYELNIVDDLEAYQTVYETASEHHIGYIPVIEYLNNKEGIGDYEQQIPLIDAYNILMSDRVNDKEQFIDAILVMYGSQLGDDEDEVNESIKSLRENKLLELPEGAKAEYLTRIMDEAGAEVLRKAIKEDIYTFSHVPNLTDENFIGNNSGVALEYKLLGLEMITKVKERYFKKGLKKRIRNFCNYMSLMQILVEGNSIVASFARALPKDLVTLSQTITNLKGTVSTRTLLSLIPFVEDPDEELEAVEEESQKAMERQKQLFEEQGEENIPLDGSDKETDSKEENEDSKKKDFKVDKTDK